MSIRALRFCFSVFVLAISSLVVSAQTDNDTETTGKVVPRLPVPSGPFGIGRVACHWIDTSRPDRYSSLPRAHRELMVYLWYPSAEKAAGATGAYLPGAKQMDADPEIQHRMRDDYGVIWPHIVSGAIYSHAVDNVAPAAKPLKFPVVLLSHGLGGSGFGYTSLIEDLVSRGYLVAAIEHTYTAGAVVFPNGTIVPQHHDSPVPGLTPDEGLKRMMASVGATITEGAADVRFVLDKLTILNDGHPGSAALAGRLDLHNVAAMGHSAGAEFAARACQLDARFKSCVDLDGGMVPVSALPEYPDGATLKQPLLFLEVDYSESKMFGTHEQHLAYFKKREEQLETCVPGSYAVALRSPSITHGSYSDDLLLEAANPVQADAARHNLDLIETFVRTFLDQTLRDGHGNALDTVQTSEATIRKIGH